MGINPVDAKRLYGDKVPSFFGPLLAWLLEDRVCGIDFSGTVVGAPGAYSAESGAQALQVGDDIYGMRVPVSYYQCVSYCHCWLLDLLNDFARWQQLIPLVSRSQWCTRRRNAAICWVSGGIRVGAV